MLDEIVIVHEAIFTVKVTSNQFNKQENSFVKSLAQLVWRDLHFGSVFKSLL